jgi:hypothetical protein
MYGPSVTRGAAFTLPVVCSFPPAMLLQACCGSGKGR